MSAIIAVNPNDKDWTSHRYILWFGACGTTRLMVWANSVDDALDECIDWLVENAPGHLCDDVVKEEYERAIKVGMLSEEEAQEYAEQDMTCGGNCGNYIASWEWGIVAEDPTREEIRALTE